MELDVYCCACREYVFQADTDTLREPMIGHMFKVKRNMEWSMFSPDVTDKDLTCSLCNWTFHNNGELTVQIEGKTITGTPNKILEALGIEQDKSEPVDESTTDSTGIPEMGEPNKEKIIDQINEKINKVTEVIKEEVFNEPKPSLEVKKKAGRPFGSKTKNKKKKRKKRVKNKSALEKMGL